MSLKARLMKLQQRIGNKPSKTMKEYNAPILITAYTPEEVENKKQEILKDRANKLNLDFNSIKFKGPVIVDNIPKEFNQCH